MTTRTVAAVDIGASSGRVMLATVSEDSLDLREVHRFANRPVRVAGTLHWDVLALYTGVLDGLREVARLLAAREGDLRLDGIGIDTWAVDYGLLDADGALVGLPVHYRDGRTDGVAEKVSSTVGADELYRRTGIQHLPFNTVNQLVAEQSGSRLRAAHRALLVPDLLAYWLTGAVGAEVTNASTTQLLDARSRRWDTELMSRLGIAESLLPPLHQPGEVLGELRADVLGETGLRGPVPVVAVGSHDTASAVVGVPADGEHFAYVSSGTWSLVGVELDQPVLTEASRAANLTNEAGVDGTVRYLRNVMGLWLLQESLRTWADDGEGHDLSALLRAASDEPAGRWVVDVDHPSLLPPGDMPARLVALCREAGTPEPRTKAQVVRCIVDSLAEGHRRAVDDIRRLTGRAVDVVHVVGGGARNALLCQATADACGVPVLAGPVEATALGNVLVQARALGVDLADLAAMRALLRSTQELVRYEPSPAATG